MTAAVDPALLKKTQEELGKYVKKPPLTDKLLSKPPFRFLHDIINAVITGTGFLDGLFTDDELSSQNIKDKEAKVAFLQKCIDATSIATGETFSVRPSKIVAGQDVEKTNEWLQGLGRAISKKVDSSEAVQQVLSGVKPEKPKKSEKEKQEKKPREKSSKKETDKPEKKDNGKKEGPSKKDKSKDEKEKKKSSSSKSKKDSKEDKKDSKEEKEDKEKDRRKSKSDPPPTKPKSSKSRAASRMSQVKESGKENSPPEEIIENEEVIPSGEGAVDDVEPPMELQPSRPPSSRKVESEDQPDDIDVPVDEGIGDTQETPIEEPEVPLDSSDEPQVPLDSLVVDDDNSEKGPPSLTGMAGEEMEIVGALDGETLPQETDERENDNKTPLISSLVNENNNIDPAILKAMAPNGPSLEGEDHLGLPSALEAPDSGVGSLESPKHPPDQEQQDSSETNAPTPTSASKSGPQPLRALEHFGEDPTAPSPSQFSVNDVEEQPNYPTREKSSRPRTGRRSARPPSARPAPPKVRERREIPKEELPRPSTGKPVANVILSSDKADGDDDDDNFMVEETKPVMEDDLSGVVALEENATAAGAAAASVREDGEGAGLLVAQILETKKELEDGRRSAFSPETPGHRRVQIEQSELSDANRRKEREIIEKDVQKLSGSIQSITRSVNPLAKMLDYLQEDLDSMQKELEMWRDENKKLAQTLKREQSMTEQELEPLRSQLAELESAVQEQRDKLSAVKSNILRNSEKISRLMAGINLHM
ncbi:TRAF3-interacting protein 1-like isoform X3 [Macrobrachium nipponense]|uniref:TRAF3-interacting protein 1-like isoform X3 n=1 Tax=Macrobrachium nipponense TaxID=159736 RepID=UPI0030C85444